MARNGTSPARSRVSTCVTGTAQARARESPGLPVTMREHARFHPVPARGAVAACCRQSGACRCAGVNVCQRYRVPGRVGPGLPGRARPAVATSNNRPACRWSRSRPRARGRRRHPDTRDTRPRDRPDSGRSVRFPVGPGPCSTPFRGFPVGPAGGVPWGPDRTGLDETARVHMRDCADSAGQPLTRYRRGRPETPGFTALVVASYIRDVRFL